MNTKKFIKKLEEAVENYTEFEGSDYTKVKDKLNELLDCLSRPPREFNIRDRVSVTVNAFYATSGIISDVEFMDDTEPGRWMYEVNGDWYLGCQLRVIPISEFVIGDIVIFDGHICEVQEVMPNYFAMIDALITRGELSIVDNNPIEVGNKFTETELCYTNWVLVRTLSVKGDNIEYIASVNRINHFRSEILG